MQWRACNILQVKSLHRHDLWGKKCHIRPEYSADNFELSVSQYLMTGRFLKSRRYFLFWNLNNTSTFQHISTVKGSDCPKREAEANPGIPSGALAHYFADTSEKNEKNEKKLVNIHVF